MKRLIRIAAAAVLAGSLVSGPALADGHGHGHGYGRGHDRGGGAWSREGPGPRGERWAREPAEGDERGGGRWGYAPPPDAYEPYPAAPVYPRRLPPPSYGLRRGGLVPPAYRGAEVPDYGRHRLRPPPPGFAWMRIGDRYMLVSRATGQIFDVIGD